MLAVPAVLAEGDEVNACDAGGASAFERDSYAISKPRARRPRLLDAARQSPAGSRFPAPWSRRNRLPADVPVPIDRHQGDPGPAQARVGAGPHEGAQQPGRCRSALQEAGPPSIAFFASLANPILELRAAAPLLPRRRPIRNAAWARIARPTMSISGRVNKHYAPASDALRPSRFEPRRASGSVAGGHSSPFRQHRFSSPFERRPQLASSARLLRSLQRLHDWLAPPGACRSDPRAGGHARARTVFRSCVEASDARLHRRQLESTRSRVTAAGRARGAPR